MNIQNLSVEGVNNGIKKCSSTINQSMGLQKYISGLSKVGKRFQEEFSH